MKLVKILLDKVQIKTDNAEFENSRLNDLISISDGEVEIVAQITSITDNDAEMQMDDNALLEELEQPSLKTIECSILGSVVEGRFKQQLDRYPACTGRIKKVSPMEFAGMMATNHLDDKFQLGNYVSYCVPAFVDGNKFFQRHSCIVGNTGSGKSETVAKILEETAGATDCNIVVFDIHGEYSNLSYVDSIKVGNNFPFPVWMLGFSDMVSNILKVKEESATVAVSALRKAYAAICPNKNENKPVCFSFEKLLGYMKELNVQLEGTGEFYASGKKAGMEKMVKGDYNGKLSGIINTMESICNDKRYSFLFMDESQMYLEWFINRIMGRTKPVKNIDLSDVPHDAAVLIIGAITKLIYNIQLARKDSIRPITLVCDEAHVYIPVDFQLSASQRRMVEIFENIAKEGRKFGITLFVASQRPSELNKTIMAQCANYIVMKLNNENDKTMMKGIMAEGSSRIIESTTMFSPGDAIIVGDCVPIPLKIHVELAKERPCSKTINFWDEWKKETADISYDEELTKYLSS